MGDGDAYQRAEQREDGHYTDRALDMARLYIQCELDRTLVDAWQACSVAQEVRIVAAESITQARHCGRGLLNSEGKRSATACRPKRQETTHGILARILDDAASSRSSVVAGGAIHACGRRPIRSKSARSKASR